MALVLIALAVGTRSATPTLQPQTTPTPTPTKQGAVAAPASAEKQMDDAGHVAERVMDSTPPAAPLPVLVAADVAAGGVLYKEHCASCHGANLEGQPNWKKPLENGKFPAPPHDDSGHTWHHNDAILIRITLNGGGLGDGDMTRSDMPGFKDKLSEAQVWQILSFIKSRWSQASREYQWARTLEGN